MGTRWEEREGGGDRESADKEMHCERRAGRQKGRVANCLLGSNEMTLQKLKTGGQKTGWERRR